jgi:Tetratricopeptide repeat.
MKNLKLLILSALLLTTPLWANQPAIDDVTFASNTGDTEHLELLLQTATPGTYERAYLEYRLGVDHYRLGKSESADDFLKDSITTLKEVVSQDPDSAEAHALMSTAIGMRISFNPVIRGMTMGAASNSALDKAEELDPDNPRVLLIKGIGAFNTPTLFGGGNKKAMNALDKSISIYSGDASGWGQADAYIWRGLIHKSNGDIDQARADFSEALSVAPEHGWAASLLTTLD